MNRLFRSLFGAGPVALRAPALIALLAAFLSSTHHAQGAGPAELYGKPLRGLSPVRLAVILASPERFAGKSIRVVGAGAKSSTEGSAAVLTISEGPATLRLETDGSFTLPEKLEGAQVTAEGKVRKESTDPAPIFVAIGIEVKR